jgi:hypothetical protein
MCLSFESGEWTHEMPCPQQCPLAERWLLRLHDDVAQVRYEDATVGKTRANETETLR